MSSNFVINGAHGQEVTWMQYTAAYMLTEALMVGDPPWPRPQNYSQVPCQCGTQQFSRII